MREKIERWVFPITIPNILLIVLGVALNVGGRMLSQAFSWPIWADSVGTFLIGTILGPFAGAISGCAAATVLGMFDPLAYYYAPLGAVVGFVIGANFPHGQRMNKYRVFMVAFMISLLAATFGTVINMIFRGGEVGNVWGDALVEWITPTGKSNFVQTFLGELLVHFPDKILSVIIAMSIIGTTMLITGKKDTFLKLYGLGLALILFAGSFVGIATDVQAEGSYKRELMAEYVSKIYSSGDGLYSTEMNAIAQTKDGYIWAGGYSGLYRFDGTSFIQMDLGNSINSITSLYADDQNNLWIGTNDMGVVKYNTVHKKVYTYGVNRGMPSESVRSIQEGPGGNIFVGTVSYSALIRPYGMVGTYNQDELLNYINNFSINEEDACVCVSQSGYVLVIAEESVPEPKYCSTPDAFYVSATWGKGGDLWLSTSTNVIEHYRWVDGKLTPRGTLSTGNLNYLNKIFYSSYFGGIFVCAENGVGFVDNDGEFWDLTEVGFDSSVNDVLVDYQGNIWFTSSKQGVLKMSPSVFSNLTKRARIDTGMVNCVLRDGRELMIGTDKGIYVEDIYSNEVIHYDWMDQLADARISHIMKDSKGSLWICTFGEYGILEIRPDGECVTYGGVKDDENATPERFRMAIEMSDGTIAAASMSGIYYIRDEQIVDTFTEEDGLRVPQILCLLETEDKKLLACSDGDGVYVIRDGKIIEHINTRVGLNSQVVLRAIHCGYGYIYVTSNALFYDDRDNIQRLTNFPYSNNYDAYVTEDNKLWVSSSAGVIVADVDDVIENKEGYAYTLLDHTRGLDSGLTLNCWNTTDGEDMFLCCTDGVRRVPRNGYELSTGQYNIAIDEITMNDTDVPHENGAYQLPAGVGRLVIRPAILNYSMTNPTIHYYIEGVPESDITAKQDALSAITLTDIKYGKYNLHIQVMDDVTGAVQQERIFPIYKAPKMYEETYFRTYVFCIALIFVAFLAWIIAQMRSLSTIEQQYEEIRIAKDEAEVANKAKSNFLASMSHEIRTPINAVLGMDEMILRESKDDSILEYATDIYSAGQTLLSLINEILDSSKIESGKMEIVPEEYELGGMIHNLHNLIIQRASVADLSLIVEVDKNLPKKLRGDDVRIRQIITNMLSNAVKYTKEGTVWFRVQGVCEGNIAHLHVEVEDTGEGIKEEDIPHLFDAYRRLDLGKNHYVEGTGLGLNISMRLLELMGSRLQVSSVYGEGSKFYFDLDQEIIDATPLGEDYDPTRSKDIVTHRNGGHFIAPKAKVLVVDDNSMNRRVFKSLVKQMQMQVSEAASGPEAIEYAKTEYFDLIFMDHMMPEMDGVEAMQYIRSLKGIPCEHTPIYVLTANAITGAREAYLEAGFDGFVSKPIIFEKLEEALEEALPAEYIEPMPEGMETKSSGGPQPPEDLPSVEGLDWSFAWLHLPSVDLLRESLGEFYTLIPVQSKKLQAMYEALLKEPTEEAWENYRILVHAMKGLAATVGIIPLAGPAKILEFAAKDGNIDIIKNLHPVFLREWNSYSQKLVGVFDIGTAQEAPRQPGNLKILQKLSDIIIGALKHMDIDRADKAVAKLQEFTFGEAVDADITTLVGAVTDLDEELSKATLEEMISKLQE